MPIAFVFELSQGATITRNAEQENAMSLLMPMWQRLLITLVAMLIVSFVIGYLWQAIFLIPLPSYLAGVIGGLTALPVWEFLKRIRPG